MPLNRCPICAATDAVEVYRRRAPLLTVKRLSDPGPDRFAELRLVACAACGHMRNAGYDPSFDEALYADGPLTNVPVDPSMVERLRDLIGWLELDGAAAPPDIVEIGCGSGHLSRILAPFARSVTVYEPNRSLTPAMLPEPSIRLISAPLPAEGAAGSADLIICRQVLEHLSDPAALMRSLRACLRPGGRAYLEVPDGDYVARHAAFMDIHPPHVQYFTRDGFVRAAAQAGFAPLKEQRIKDGHDFGVLFAAVDPQPDAPVPTADRALIDGLAAALTERIAVAAARLAALGPGIILYGATAQAQAFINSVDTAGRCAAVFDDTEALAGFALFDGRHVIPVTAPSAERLATAPAVVITAYLHDAAIAGKLRRSGFDGPILTIRPNSPGPRDYGLEPPAVSGIFR
jgi:SAM-dependent methyltransferase